MKINNLKYFFKPMLCVFVLITSHTANAEIGGDFTLKDYNNNMYKLSDSNKTKIIFFGFLNCPDICPTALTEVSSLLKNLEKLSNRIEPIFITVDPTRDTPKLLKNYLTFFDERIVGLTGTQEQIEEVSNKYHVYYSYQNKGEVKNYTVNHTANMYLVNKDNKVEKIFIPGTPFQEFFKYINRYLMKEVKNLPLQ